VPGTGVDAPLRSEPTPGHDPRRRPDDRPRHARGAARGQAGSPLGQGVRPASCARLRSDAGIWKGRAARRRRGLPLHRYRLAQRPAAAPDWSSPCSGAPTTSPRAKLRVGGRQLHGPPARAHKSSEGRPRCGAPDATSPPTSNAPPWPGLARDVLEPVQTGSVGGFDSQSSARVIAPLPRAGGAAWGPGPLGELADGKYNAADNRTRSHPGPSGRTCSMTTPVPRTSRSSENRPPSPSAARCRGGRCARPPKKRLLGGYGPPSPRPLGSPRLRPSILLYWRRP
jgi:hypothetical protein